MLPCGSGQLRELGTLINVALEMLVAESLELLGFTVLDRLATKIRAEVNGEIIAGISERITESERAGLLATVFVWQSGVESMFTRMKKSAKRPTWTHFKTQSQYLKEIDELGDSGKGAEGVAESKIADFAAEAAGTLRGYDPDKQVALLACMVHTARGTAMTWRTCCAIGSRSS